MKQPENNNELRSEYYKDSFLPGDLEARTVEELKRRSLLHPGFFGKRTIRCGVSIIVFLFLLVTGYLAGTNNLFQHKKNADNSKSKKYLLLLYHTKDFIASNDHVAEYKQWLLDLRRLGIHADGEELANESWEIGNANRG